MKIDDILNQSKPCFKYAAMDENGEWWLFAEKPFVENHIWMPTGYGEKVNNDFDVDSFDGDWKESLIERKIG